MWTSIVLEKVDLMDEDLEFARIIETIERFKKMKLKGASLPTGWNLLQGPLNVTCCLCKEKKILFI